MKMQKRKRLWAALLSAVLIVTQLPAVAMAENNAPEDGSIASFKPLGSGKSSTASPSNAGEGVLGGNAGDSSKKGSEKTITGWTFVDDENLNEGELSLTGVSMEQQADFGAVVSMLPKQISAEIEGEAEPDTLDIASWSCTEYIKDNDGNWPLAGEYTFTAKLPDGYACAPPPSVMVTLGEAAFWTINDKHQADGLLYHETGSKTVQLIGPIDAAYTGTVRVPAEIISQGRTYAVTSIGNSAFYKSGITGLDLNRADNLTRIGSSAFSSCSSLTETVAIPAGVAEIDENAFEQSGITGLDFSGANGLKGIGANAFYQCTGLTGTVSIPAGLTDIGDAAFEQSGVTGLDLSGAASLKQIGKYAFSQCTGLTGPVSIPAGITDIGDRAFSLSGITGLDLSGANGLKRIGSNAFYQCTSLTGLVSIPAGVTDIDDGAFRLSGITGLDLSGANGLKRIGADAFYRCASLTGTVSIPATVAEIGHEAFWYSNVTGFTAADNVVAILLKDSGVNADKITLSGGGSPSFPPAVTFSVDMLEYRVTGPDTVCVIGLEYGSGSLDIPGQVSKDGKDYQVTEIGEFAFEMEDSITGLNLSSATSLARIGRSAFFNLDNLTGSVSIPAAVTEIGTDAFSLSGITSLDLSGADSLAHIGEGAFSNCPALGATVEIPAAVTEIGASAFSLSGITGLDLSGADSLTSIGRGAFYVCPRLTGTVHIPAAVTEIGKFAFSGSNITGLDLSGADSLTSIRNAAFRDCKRLAGKADIPVTVTQIGNNAFELTMITEAVIRGRLQSIGNRAFPPNIPIHCSDPHTQLLVNEALRNTDIPTASWDGQDDVPSSAIVTADRDITVNGNVTIGEEAKIAIGDGITVTVGNGAAVDVKPGAVITVKPGGTLTIDPGALVNGDGTIEVEPGGTLNGTPGSGITVTYRVTVVSGDGGGMFQADAQVRVTAFPAPTGQVFDKWTSQDGVSFANAGSLSTTFTMPAKVVTVTATYKAAPVTTHTVIFDPAGGTRTGGGELTQVVPAGASATAPIVTRSSYTFAGWDKDFSRITADLTVTAQWNKNSSTGGSDGGSYSEPEPQSSYTVTGDSISQSVSRSGLMKLADTGKSLALRCDKASMAFNPAALKAILAAVPATVNDITFTAAPADMSAFPEAAKLIGPHPVYSFNIRYKDSLGNLAAVSVSFPAGSAAVALDYAPVAAEITGNLFMVYVDGKGAAAWLDKSIYGSGKMLAEVPHFSTYGVAYKASAPVFTDITGHPAKEDITFVAARGLLSGTGNGLFSPDGSMTRGMFVTALGRLAGVNPDSYQTRSFTDVRADAYYAAYVEWAAQKDIVKGTGEGLFSPDAPVTREQMAVMMANYAGQTGYSIPATLAAATFADSSKISEWAAKDVAAMQRAGIVRGRDGNRFDPQENATRAEASAVLRRFVEIVIDPGMAAGWVKNDSGHWLYYKGGTALTGWQTIGNLRYFFNADGVMHEGWKQDESTGKWYCWTNAGAATGWMEIGGKWYYFDENGVMAVNTKVDGYEVGPDGARKDSSQS